ncbi:MAG: MFS transporter [Casimicrobiaceae bacterium]
MTGRRKPQLRRTLRLLQAARVARSVAQGVLAVDFALYLKSLHWSGAAIGSVLAGGLIFGVVMTIAGAVASDRIGRKRFLLAYDAMFALACVAAMVTTNVVVLGAAAVVGAFGRGANGSAGPFATLEKAWLAQGLDPGTRSRVLSTNATLGFLGMAAGAACAIVPGLMSATMPADRAYRPIFAVALLFALICLGLIAMAEDRHVAVDPPGDASAERVVRHKENRNLRLLALANFLQGTGIGLAGPLVSYWFAIRFGIGPRHIAPLIAAGFLLAAASSQATVPLSRRYGLMRVIVTLRVCALALLFAFPFAPNLAAAVGIFLLRNTLNRATNGPRSAITASLVRNRRLGLAGMISSISRQIPRSVGPLVAGALFDSGMLAAPFVIGAAFQAGYLWLYQRSFNVHDPLRPAGRTAGDAQVESAR